MGTVFDDFIKQQKESNHTNVSKPYIKNSKPIPRNAHINKSSSSSLPHVRKPQNRYSKLNSSSSGTEFSGADFEPRAASGYPKGALNVLIVFFATFFEEICYALTSRSTSWDTTADDYNPNSDNS